MEAQNLDVGPCHPSKTLNCEHPQSCTQLGRMNKNKQEQWRRLFCWPIFFEVATCNYGGQVISSIRHLCAFRIVDRTNIGGTDELQDMEHAIQEVCRLVPIEKAYALIQRYAFEFSKTWPLTIVFAQQLRRCKTIDRQHNNKGVRIQRVEEVPCGSRKGNFEQKREHLEDDLACVQILQRLANLTSIPDEDLRSNVLNSQTRHNLWSSSSRGDDPSSHAFVMESVSFLKSWFTSVSME